MSQIIDKKTHETLNSRRCVGASSWVAGTLLSAAIVQAGCDKTTAPPLQDNAPVDLASITAWDPAYQGTVAGDMVGKGGLVEGCLGFVDNVTVFPESEETRAEGWTWNSTKSAPYDAVIVTDKSGQVIGAGVTSTARPDVTDALPEIVTNQMTGYVAFAHGQGGELDIYAWDRENDTLCPLAPPD